MCKNDGIDGSGAEPPTITGTLLPSRTERMDSIDMATATTTKTLTATMIERATTSTSTPSHDANHTQGVLVEAMLSRNGREAGDRDSPGSSSPSSS